MANHVLVVDDEPGIREVITATLAEAGLSVETAANGREALAQIAERRPALVLLDLQMPVLSGWDVLAQLQREQANIPVVFMTAGVDSQAEAEWNHADGYLAKPFELGELLRVVERFRRPMHG